MTTKQSVTFRLSSDILTQLENGAKNYQKSKTQILEESLRFWLKKINKTNKFGECIGILTEVDANSWLKKIKTSRKNKPLTKFD